MDKTDPHTERLEKLRQLIRIAEEQTRRGETTTRSIAEMIREWEIRLRRKK